MGRKGTERCSVDGCSGTEVARGWCVKHYNRWLRHGDPLAGRDRAPNTDGAPCTVEGCAKPQQARGYCPAHYQRHRLYGDPLGQAPARVLRTIEDLRREAFEGKPGGTVDPRGYRYRTLRRGERYADHRLVMEHMLGRALLPGENVHHRNGDRADNRASNLELWVTPQDRGQRVEDLVAFVVTRYPDLVRKAMR